MFTPTGTKCQMSDVTCHVSHVMCHMSTFSFFSDRVAELIHGGSVIVSRVTCRISHVTCHVSHVNIFSSSEKVAEFIHEGSGINGAYLVFKEMKVNHSDLFLL